MRYQRSFPNVIPHAKAGCSRVTHPSATKLPLSKLSSNSVRLECVMHAASVHPEPGSNSRIIVSHHISVLISLLSKCADLFSLVCGVFLLLIGFLRNCRVCSYYYSVLVLYSFVLALYHCSVFKDRSPTALADSFCIISLLPYFVNTFFEFFFSFFENCAMYKKTPSTNTCFRGEIDELHTSNRYKNGIYIRCFDAFHPHNGQAADR